MSGHWQASAKQQFFVKLSHRLV